MRMTLMKRSGAKVVGVAAALTLGLVGTAVATGSSPSAPYQGCSNSDSVLSGVLPNGKCPVHTTLVTIAGAQGIQGVPGPAGPAGVVALYDSTAPQGIYSQAFNGPQVTQFGNAVNLASNPTGAALGSVSVGMVNFGPTAFTTPITFSIYNLGTGGVVGSLLATLTETVSVPNAPANANGHTVFNATFDFSSQNVVLPSTVVYGITLNQLATDCAANTSDCGNDPNPIGSLNVLLSSNVSSGSNVYPGDIFLSSLQADAGSTALASNFGACPGAPTGVLTTFQGVPAGCPNGYGGDVDGLGIDNIPSVKFITVG